MIGDYQQVQRPVTSAYGFSSNDEPRFIGNISISPQNGTAAVFNDFPYLLPRSVTEPELLKRIDDLAREIVREKEKSKTQHLSLDDERAIDLSGERA